MKVLNINTSDSIGFQKKHPKINYEAMTRLHSKKYAKAEYAMANSVNLWLNSNRLTNLKHFIKALNSGAKMFKEFVLISHYNSKI